MSEPCSDPSFPQPTEQHQWLMSHVGKWNVHCEFFTDPSQPPMQMAATDTCEAHGAFFTVSRFEADMFGMPYTGIATMGYDPIRGRFESTWADTMSPCLFHFTGDFDASGKVLEMRAEAPAPGGGGLTDWRTTEEHLDDGSRRFEMFMRIPGGPEIKMFTHRYVRA